MTETFDDHNGQRQFRTVCYSTLQNYHELLELGSITQTTVVASYEHNARADDTTT